MRQRFIRSLYDIFRQRVQLALKGAGFSLPQRAQRPNQRRQRAVVWCFAARALTMLRAQTGQFPAVQRAGQAVAHTFHSVMRLVHQKGQVPSPLKQPLDLRKGVKGIVEVHQHHIRQLHQREGQFKGAYTMPLRRPDDALVRPYRIPAGQQLVHRLPLT